jgi:hypothetical protein
MNARVRWIAAVAIVAAVVAIGLMMQSATSPIARRMTLTVPATPNADSVAAAPAPVEAKTIPHISRTAASSSHGHALPDPRTPLADAVSTLREYAEAGDTDAAVELSWRLSGCTDVALKRAQELEQSLHDDIEREPSDDRFTPEQHAARTENLQRQIDEYASQRKACLDLPADARVGWLEWIDRAAQAGNTAAMRGYARMAIGEYHSTNDVRSDIDAAIERRDKARAYLDKALRLGDAEALRDLADAYRDSAHPTIYPLDPSKAYAYAYAATLAGISRGNDLDRTMEETARSLDGQQLAEAEAAGRRLYEKCCAKR